MTAIRPIIQPPAIKAAIQSYLVTYVQQLSIKYFNTASASVPLPYTINLPIAGSYLSTNKPAGIVNAKYSPYLTPRMQQDPNYSHTIMARELHISISQLRTMMFGPEFPALETYLRFICLAQIGNRPTNPPHDYHYRRQQPDEFGELADMKYTPSPDFSTVGNNMATLVKKLKWNTPAETQLAESTGISRPSLRKIAIGQMKNINLKTILKVAAFYALTDERPLEEVMNNILSVEPISEYLI